MKKLIALVLAAVMVLGLMPTMTTHVHATEHTHGIEEYPALTADVMSTVEITTAGSEVYYTFTPDATDLYYIYSTTLDSYVDTVGTIYDAGMNMIASNDDAIWGNEAGISSPNFLLAEVLEAGVTYVISARAYNSYWTGTFGLTAQTGHEYESEITKPANCTEDGILTYTCTHCGNSYTEVIPAAHEYSDETGRCIHCDEAYLITGTCGDALTWSLDWFGKLTISGTGAMYNYSLNYENHFPAPWYETYSYDIKSIVVEDGVTSIGNYAFRSLGEAVSAVLPESVTSIGEYAFSSMWSLKEIVLPSAITVIPTSCFNSCGALTSIVWPAALERIEDNAFSYSGLGDLVIPEGVTYIGESAFSGSGSISKLTLPSTLTELAGYAFSSMWALQEVVFTGDAPIIGDNAFNYITADIWYPLGNETWTEEVRQNYGGTLTWKPLCSGSHTYGAPVTVPATCEHGSYMTVECTICGFVAVSPENDDALGHDLIETVIPPDCSNWQYGRTEVTCTRCDYYESKDWVPYEHSYTSEVIEATCTTDGCTKYTCTVCGDYYTENYVYATGHTVEVWTETTEATCTEDGTRTGTCTVCSETVTETVESALGHEWNMEAGTENADGTITYPCIRCDATYTTEGIYLYVGDNQCTMEAGANSVTKYFNAAENGTLTVTLNNLYYLNTYSQAWTTLAIDWAFSQGFFNVYINGVNTPYTVEGYETSANIILASQDVNAGDQVTVEINHLEASYYYGRAIQLNANVTFVPSHTHSYTAVVTEPTCTEGGYTTYTCECGDSYIADETAALGHTDEVIPAVDATCTETGLTEGKKCSVCGEILVAQEVIPALGHSWKGTDCENCDATRENPFTDVPEDSFYIDPVLWAVEKGITKGATETTFAPDRDVTRAEVVTFLWRYYGSPVVEGTNPFTDVNETDFYYDAVLWAVANGITAGKTETTFAPLATCTRAEALTFLWRAEGKPDINVGGGDEFTDVDPDSFYAYPVMWALENGITQGMGDGTFGTYTVCNRAHIVTFLYRTLD